jgi:hypothetical protein
MDCMICGKGDDDRQNIRKGEKACSIECEKRLTGEFPIREMDLRTTNLREVHLWRVFNVPGYKEWYDALPGDTRRPRDTTRWGWVSR